MVSTKTKTWLDEKWFLQKQNLKTKVKTTNNQPLSLWTILFLYLHRLYIIEWDTNFPQEIWNLYSWGSQPKKEFIIWAK